MSITQNIVHQKLGATFASGEEAKADLQSAYSPELKAKVDQWIADITASGLLISPTVYTWNQENQTLTVSRTVTDLDELRVSRTFTKEEVLEATAVAGWSNIDFYLSDL